MAVVELPKSLVLVLDEEYRVGTVVGWEPWWPCKEGGRVSIPPRMCTYQPCGKGGVDTYSCPHPYPSQDITPPTYIDRYIVTAFAWELLLRQRNIHQTLPALSVWDSDLPNEEGAAKIPLKGISVESKGTLHPHPPASSSFVGSPAGIN